MSLCALSSRVTTNQTLVGLGAPARAPTVGSGWHAEISDRDGRFLLTRNPLGVAGTPAEFGECTCLAAATADRAIVGMGTNSPTIATGVRARAFNVKVDGTNEALVARSGVETAATRPSSSRVGEAALIESALVLVMAVGDDHAIVAEEKVEDGGAHSELPEKESDSGAVEPNASGAADTVETAAQNSLDSESPVKAWRDCSDDGLDNVDDGCLVKVGVTRLVGSSSSPLQLPLPLPLP